MGSRTSNVAAAKSGAAADTRQIVPQEIGATSDNVSELDLCARSGPRSSHCSAENESRNPDAFDYNAEAELFPTNRRISRPRPVGYKRFARAADAIRFAIEDLPSDLLLGAYLEVETGRFDSDGIRKLYESPAYPLQRAGPPVRQWRGAHQQARLRLGSSKMLAERKIAELVPQRWTRPQKERLEMWISFFVIAMAIAICLCAAAFAM
jgi:hypothetical protein